MPFMREDEYILLFDLPNRAGEMMAVDDLKALRDCGVDTVVPWGTDWNKYEPKPGRFSRKYIELFLLRYVKAGIKVLLPLWDFVNTSLDPDWYAKTAPGTSATCGGRIEWLLSPFNLDAQAKALDVMRKVHKDYTSPTCQIVSVPSRNGESVMPQDPRYFDTAALASWRMTGNRDKLPEVNFPSGKRWLLENYTRLLLEQQRILIETPWREIWTFYHIAKAGRPLCGVQFLSEYYAAFQELKPTQIHHVSYDYFHFTSMDPEIARLSRTYDTSEWVGAEYCEGLRDGNAGKAIATGKRGLILAPCHPYTTHQAMAPWMLKEVKRAVQLFERRQV